MLLVLFGFDPKQIVSFEELLMSQVVAQEVLTRLLIVKGIFTKDEFMEMVKAVDRERKKNLLIQNHISVEVTNEMKKLSVE
jgi:hypothetical protein